MRWGDGEHYLDVKEYFKAQCDNKSSCSIYIGGNLGQDPSPGHVKIATYKWKCGTDDPFKPLYGGNTIDWQIANLYCW